jgi:hypothetical protein
MTALISPDVHAAEILFYHPAGILSPPQLCWMVSITTRGINAAPVVITAANGDRARVGFGSIRATYPTRQIQFALKLMF